MYISLILQGIIVGTSSAASPGPLMALLVRETLRKGWKAGIFVAITPIITDGPLVVLAMVFAQSIRLLPEVLGAISIIGGFFLIYLGIESVRGASQFEKQKGTVPQTLFRAIIVNLLNPYPYIFWLTVATPIFAQGNIMGSITFAAALLGAVFATMATLTLAIALIRERFLRVIPLLIKILGCVLIVFALLFIRKGILLFAS